VISTTQRKPIVLPKLEQKL